MGSWNYAEQAEAITGLQSDSTSAGRTGDGSLSISRHCTGRVRSGIQHYFDVQSGLFIKASNSIRWILAVHVDRWEQVS